jgi:hypothetical protein
MLGRVLGVLVILLSVGVLGGGAIVVLGSPPSGSPSATRSPVPSPTPSPAEPTASGSTPSPAVSRPATPSPPPSATPFLPIVQVGPGFVTFGTQADAEVNIIDPRSSFQIDETVAWSAYLTEPANSADLQVRVLKLDAAVETGERLISEAGVQPLVQGAQRFGRRIKPARVLDGPGIYVVRCVRGETVMSEGYFLIED